MYNLPPLNSPTHYYLHIYQYLCIQCFAYSLHIHTTDLYMIPTHCLPGGTGKKRKKAVGSRWTCFGANKVPRIWTAKRELKSAISAPYDHNVRPSQTDRRTNIMAIARRFVLTNASRANNGFHIFLL